MSSIRGEERGGAGAFQKGRTGSLCDALAGQPSLPFSGPREIIELAAANKSSIGLVLAPRSVYIFIYIDIAG